ncbi:unnamed protein product, partial [Timema podura]|nr:unnamed protein product [Timema podura]
MCLTVYRLAVRNLWKCYLFLVVAHGDYCVWSSCGAFSVCKNDHYLGGYNIMSAGPYNYSYIFKYIIIGDMGVVHPTPSTLTLDLTSAFLSLSLLVTANMLLINFIPMASTFLVFLLSKVKVSAAYVSMGMKYPLYNTSGAHLFSIV